MTPDSAQRDPFQSVAAPASADVGDIEPLRDPALYFNRELSQLDFNFRVLAQAHDPQVPLPEGIRRFVEWLRASGAPAPANDRGAR